MNETLSPLISTKCFLVRPVITEKPKDQTLKEDEKAVLNCKATSEPPSKITWLKDGDRIREDARVVVLSNGSLVINKVLPKDTGVYKCSADHDGGWSDSAEARLIVWGKYMIVQWHLYKAVIEIWPGEFALSHISVTGNPS